MEIKGSVVVLTGAGSGIGAAVATYFARRGARIVIVDLRQEQVDQVVSALRAEGAEAIGVQANVTSEADTARFIAAAIEAFGRINIVVACAGVIQDGTMLSLDKTTHKVSRKLTLEKWQSVLDVNLTGTFLTMRDAAEAMANGGWDGLLVPISSVNKVGQLGQLNYSSTKVAIALMPKIMVGEFLMRGIRNIRCVAIAPGYTATPMLTQMNQDALKSLLAHVPIGRLVDPAEVASLIAHCAENNAINGTTLEITGGLCHDNGIAK